MRRRTQAVIAQKRRALAESSIATYAMQFSHILPADFLHGLSSSQRIRHYCNVVVFWAWLSQMLESNSSLSKAVSLVQCWCKEARLPVPGDDTGAFSRGRGRLKLPFLRAVAARVREHMKARISPEDTYKGHVVKSIDGSSMALDDTEANQEEYPQPSSQKPGCGFPVMGIVGVLNHAHGGWEDIAEGAQAAHDAPLLQKLRHCLEAGDLLCADRAFCTYENIASLQQESVESLLRLHQARHRKLDWRRGKKLGQHERLVTWKKPAQRPGGSTLSKSQWEALPEELEVRLIRFAYRDRSGKKRRMVLATTLVDHKRYPWEELAAIYAGRWEIELRLRDVKTTMKMDHLRVKSPQAARKTLQMSLIAYNLIRASSQEAAQRAGENLRQISFKGALDTIVANTSRYLRRQKHTRVIREIWNGVMEMVAAKTINLRPGRKEPRAQKKRPKSFSYLTSPRALYQEIPHRGKTRSFA